jgi:AcrR family transcriptional regulator
MGMSRTRGEPSPQRPGPLYRSLPHGPNGMKPEEVARHQRIRLFGAMIESVDRRGYHASTVADVIALAGVSRRAFYELFVNKEHCFLSTYDIVVARERKRVIDAWQRERGWANRRHAAFKMLLDDFAETPKGPRLVLVESIGIGPRARFRMQLAGVAFERLVATVFELAPDGIGLPALGPSAVVGGVRHVAFMRLLEGREQELYTLSDELLDWIESYRSHAAVRLASLGAPRRRRVPPASAAFLTSEDKRARALGSVIHLTLDEGYSGLTDPQIAQFAGISTEAFHRQFSNKEECFLAVLDEFVTEALDSVRGPMESASSWPEAVHRAMSAFVDYLLAHEALLRMAFIDLFEVGPAIIGRLTRSVEGFTELLTEAGPAPRRGPIVAAEAITGAIWAIISSYAVNDRMARLPTLVDHLTYIVLAPYIGAKAAVESIEAARKPLHGV